MKKGRPANRKKKIMPARKARLTHAKRKSAAKRTSLARKAKPVLKPESKPSELPCPSDADLPFSYNQTKLILLARDPEWAYAYWDFSAETWNWIMKLLKEDPATRAKLRVHNLSHQTFYDLDVPLEAKNWYLHLGLPNTEFEAELGLLDSKGRFYRIIKSNRIRTPRNGPSEVIDPDWDPSEFADIPQLSGKGAQQFAASLFSSRRMIKS